MQRVARGGFDPGLDFEGAEEGAGLGRELGEEFEEGGGGFERLGVRVEDGGCLGVDLVDDVC